MLLYSFLLTLVLVAGAPYWLLRMATSGRYRAGLPERLGIIPASLRQRIAAIRVERRGAGGLRPLMWIHAVSVGEVLAAVRLIDEFKTGEFHRVRPGMVFAVSTTTQTGKRLADERLPGCATFYFPLDFGFAVRKYLELLAPDVVVLIESELWPQLISQCHKRGVPLVVANARISDRSFSRYLRLRPLWRPLLAKVAVFLAQSEESGRRLREIGAPRVEVTGNLKYDTGAAKETALVTAVRVHLEAGSQVVVCGSTLDGEEAIILDTWSAVLKAVPSAVLVIAPRHPRRFEAAAAMISQRGIPLLRASTYPRAQVAIRGGSVLLLDTIGDLAAIYSLAHVAFVGGSLVDAGGHNPLEPAQLGVPVLMGPSWTNFREIVEAMRAGEALQIVTSETFPRAVLDLLQDPERATAIGERGRAVSAAQAGAAARIATALLKLLPARPPQPRGFRR